MSEWQSIDTAPRDGTDIIVGFDAATVWVVHVAWWDDGLRGMDEMYDADGNQIPNPSDIGWWSYVLHSVTQEKLDDYRTPTHWIQLPTVPSEFEKQT